MYVCARVCIHVYMYLCAHGVNVPVWGVCLGQMENWGLEQRQRCPRDLLAPSGPLREVGLFCSIIQQKFFNLTYS